MNEVSRLSRRRVMQGAGAVVAGAALAACGATPTPQVVEKVVTEIVEREITTIVEGTPQVVKETVIVEKVVEETVVVEKEVTVQAVQEPVELRVSAWGDTPDKNINDRVAAAFFYAQGQIKMIPEEYVGGYYDKVKVNFAGGTAPDLVYMEGYQWQPFADFVVPLDDFIERDEYKDKWASVDNYDMLTTWRGKTYLTVIDTGPIVMFYNKMLFDKQGVPYPTNDWTFADFKELAAKMTFEEGGIQYYGYSITGAPGSYVWWIQWLRMDGKLEFDTLQEPHVAQWTQPEIVDALQWVNQDILNLGYAPTPATLQGGGIDVATNRVAMCVQGPWALPRYYGLQALAEGGVSYDVVMPPKGSIGSTPDAEIQGHMIASQTKHQEEAWEALKFWMGEETAKITAEEGRMCGAPEYTEKYWVPIATEKYHFEHGDVFVNAQLHGQAPMCGGAGANYTAFDSASAPLQVAADAMATGNKSAQEALTEANDLMQKALDDYWKKQG